MNPRVQRRLFPSWPLGLMVAMIAFGSPDATFGRSYRLDVSRAVASAGSDASIDIRFSANEVSVGAIAFVVSYDARRIQIAPEESASGTQNVVLKPQNSSLATSVSQDLGGRLGIVVFDASPPVGAIPSGTNVNVRFRVLPGADGFVPIQIEASPDASDINGRVLDTSIATLESGGIFVAPTRISLRSAPGALDLGEVPAGRQLTRTITLVNDGNSDIHLKNLSTTGSSAFRIGSDVKPLTLAAGAGTTVEVHFDGAAPSKQEGTLIAEFEEAALTNLRVPLRASVVPHDVTLFQDRRFLPAAARVAGGFGSYWITELSIHNPTELTQSARLRLLPDNGSALLISLAPGETRLFEDLLAAPEIRKETFAGAVEIETTTPELIVRSSTVNARVEGGRLGQTVPALQWSELFHGAETAVLTSVRNDAGIRSNVTLLNPGSVPITLTVTARKSDGSILGALNYVVGAREIRSATDVLTALGSPPGPITLSIRADSASAVFYAYASEIDNRTGAPLFQGAR